MGVNDDLSLSVIFLMLKVDQLTGGASIKIPPVCRCRLPTAPSLHDAPTAESKSSAQDYRLGEYYGVAGGHALPNRHHAPNMIRGISRHADQFIWALTGF
jgi:hypothetical protein